MHAQELMAGLRAQRIAVDEGVELHAWVGGQGPALLLVHGHPQTSAIWHRVVPTLAQHFTLVVADLRGYGDSSKPRGAPDHANYSKRVLARDLLRLMQQLGHARFSVLAHDRGARVAHRLAWTMPAPSNVWCCWTSRPRCRCTSRPAKTSRAPTGTGSS